MKNRCYYALFVSLLIFAVAAFSTCRSAEKKKGGPPPKGIPASTNPPICPSGAPADVLSPIEAMGYGDYKGVIHAHSYLSHDSEGTPSRIIQAAQTAGINFMLMTDHPSPYAATHGLRGMHGGVLFLPGEELNRGGSSLLAIDLKDNITATDTQGTIDEIHSQGGLAIISHDEGFTDWDAKGWDGMEVYNIHYDAILDKKIDKTIALVPYLEKAPDRVWCSILDKPVLYLQDWDGQLNHRRANGIAANDSHENVVYNGCQLDTYERSYGLVSTHLFLMELSADEVKRAIRRGNGYVCFDYFSSCRGFYFIATDGKTIGIMGDDYYLNPGQPSTLQIGVPKAAKISLLKDSEVYKETDGTSLTVDLTQPGIYRVEAYISTPKSKKPVQWIFSNPIYVR